MKKFLPTQNHTLKNIINSSRIDSFYKLLFQNINAVVYIIDTKGRIVYLNEFAKKISHYKLKELIGKHFKKIVAPESLNIAYKTFLQQVKGHNIKPYELVVLDKNGERIHLKTSEHILFKGSKVEGILGVATDITEHKELTEQL